MNLLSVAEIVPAPGLLPITSVEIQGWHSTDPMFAELIKRVEPTTIIEVGSWRGASALHMASLTEPGIGNAQYSPSSPGASIFCVDTWLGGTDHWINDDKAENDLKRDAFGAPLLYHQFLYNVAQSPFPERIYPIQQSSLNAARLLIHAGVSAELVYIDGSHDYEDVYSDLCAYWNLVSPGGIMFGDDFIDFPGVRLAVMRFAFERGLKLQVAPPSPFWWFEVNK